MNTLPTIDFQGKDYATVPVRLKQFREDNPRSSIKTQAMPQPDGSMIFQATILKDKGDETSADATGTAMASADELKRPKAFEKLETVATGRALSILGYLNNGQVASTEEMLEFEEYKNEQLLEEIANASHKDEFKAIMGKLTPAQKQIATPFIKQRIEELKTSAEAKKEAADVAAN